MLPNLFLFLWMWLRNWSPFLLQNLFHGLFNRLFVVSLFLYVFLLFSLQFVTYLNLFTPLDLMNLLWGFFVCFQTHNNNRNARVFVWLAICLILKMDVYIFIFDQSKNQLNNNWFNTTDRYSVLSQSQNSFMHTHTQLTFTYWRKM